jgi:hypothetical protein
MTCRPSTLIRRLIPLTPSRLVGSVEQSELNDLPTLYPDPLLDPDDPIQVLWIGHVQSEDCPCYP